MGSVHGSVPLRSRSRPAWDSGPQTPFRIDDGVIWVLDIRRGRGQP
jgi:hypothetical protein